MRLVIAILCLCLSALSPSAWAGDAGAVLQERLYLVTDRACYDAGDRMWLRVFMADASTRRPVVQSNYVHVELLDECATVFDRVTLMAREGVFNGYIDLPPSADNGTYYIRAYTRLNANRPDLESVVRVAVGKSWRGESKHISRPDHEPQVWAEPAGDSTRVYIQLPDECALTEASMAVAVSTDSVVPRLDIGTSLARDLLSDYVNGTTEIAQRVTGRVTAMDGKVLPGKATVMMLAPQADFYESTLTGIDGRFAFEDLELADSTVLIIQATDSKNRGNVLLTIDEEQFPECKYPLTSDDFDMKDYMVAGGRNVVLDELQVHAIHVARVGEIDAFSTIADASLSQERLEEIDASCLHDVFRRIAGVHLTSDERVIIRGRTSIYGDSYASIAVDGVVQPEEFDLHSIPMADVARVDVFKSGTSMIWGVDGGRGLISITTKGGKIASVKRTTPNLKKVIATGYQAAKPFISGSRTLYWNPAVKTHGNKLLWFNISRAAHFSVNIEGLTDNGKTIATHAEFISH